MRPSSNRPPLLLIGVCPPHRFQKKYTPSSARRSRSSSAHCSSQGRWPAPLEHVAHRVDEASPRFAPAEWDCEAVLPESRREGVRVVRGSVLHRRLLCGECSLRVDSGPLLQSVAGKVALSQAAVVRQTPAGGYIVGELASPNTIAEFDAAGRFIRVMPTVARGDSRNATMPQTIAVAENGAVHVFDIGYVRYASSSSEPMRTWDVFEKPEPQAHALLAFGATSASVQAMVPARGGGHAFHMIDGTGRISKSFGEGTNVTILEGFGSTRRRIAKAPNGTFWAVPPNRYSLALWDTSGVIRRRMSVKSDWFIPWDERLSLPNIRSERWPTVIQGIAVDSLGFVWTVSWEPPPSWRPERGRLSDEGLSAPLTRRETERAVHSVVEIIDPYCGVVVYRQRFPLAFEGFIGESTTIISDYNVVTKSPTYQVIRLTFDASSYLQQRVGCGER